MSGYFDDRDTKYGVGMATAYDCCVIALVNQGAFWFFAAGDGEFNCYFSVSSDNRCPAQDTNTVQAVQAVIGGADLATIGNGYCGEITP